MDKIAEPIKGEGIRHSWGVAVTRGVNDMRVFGTPGMLVREGNGVAFGQSPANQREHRSQLPTPFTLRWGRLPAEDGVSGEWIIYLPLDGALVTIAGVDVSVAHELEPAPGYPEGWYKLNSVLDRDRGGLLRLCIAGQVAWFQSDEADASEEDDRPEAEYSVLVAKASVDENTGARKVVQVLNSSLCIGVSARPWTFEPERGWSNTVYQLRYAINNNVSGANQTEDGDYCLQIDFKALPPAASVVRDVTPGVYEIEDKVVVWVGRVEGGKQTEGIYQMPVIYAYE